MQSTNAAVPCRWCGAFHRARCPWVTSMEFHPDGTVKRVEFVPPAQLRAEHASPGTAWNAAPFVTSKAEPPPAPSRCPVEHI